MVEDGRGAAAPLLDLRGVLSVCGTVSLSVIEQPYQRELLTMIVGQILAELHSEV